ncbi:MAG: 1-aminocyclopropane-1-carboxylate deaminase [Arenicella sp.]
MNLPSPIIELSDELFLTHGIKVFLKRDDLIHPEISGNKWRKLKYNIEKCRASNQGALLTFGGAYSNHIAATAALCSELSIESIGIIRGDELSVNSNETLKKATEYGMKLIFTSREEYALKEEKYFHEELRRRHGQITIVPEGGANYYGVLGCTEILKEVEYTPDVIYCAAGTATTSAGILLSSDAKVKAVSALKGGEFLKDNVLMRLKEFGFESNECKETLENYEVLCDYHFGGYAKHTAELIEFMNDFKLKHQIELDYVYTAKMMFAMYDQIKKGEFKKGQTILAIHTGGLQGNKSISDLLT